MLKIALLQVNWKFKVGCPASCFEGRRVVTADPPRQKIKGWATPADSHPQLCELLSNDTIQWLWVARKREARLLLVDLFLRYFTEKWLLPPSLSVCARIHACVCIYADVFVHTWRNQGNNVQCLLLLLYILFLKQCLSMNLKFIS